MTASKPKEDLIMVPDRPQSPDYIDMISSRHKKERERKKNHILAKHCQMQAESPLFIKSRVNLKFSISLLR